MICNCPLNPEYFFRADHIYGSAIPLLQGGMKHLRKPSKRVPRVRLPTDISLHHKNIQLYFDFLYERNAFTPYKVTQDHFPHSRNFYFKEHGQYHQIIEHIHQHVQVKRFQHRSFPGIK